MAEIRKVPYLSIQKERRISHWNKKNRTKYATKYRKFKPVIENQLDGRGMQAYSNVYLPILMLQIIKNRMTLHNTTHRNGTASILQPAVA